MPFHISGKPYSFTEEPSSTSSFIFRGTRCKSSLHSRIMSATLSGKHLNPEVSGTPSGEKLLSKPVVRTCLKVQLPLRGQHYSWDSAGSHLLMHRKGLLPSTEKKAAAYPLKQIPAAATAQKGCGKGISKTKIACVMLSH